MIGRSILRVSLVLALAGGCARKVVIDPSLVPARNDPSWVIQRPPGTAASGASAPATQPALRAPR